MAHLVEVDEIESFRVELAEIGRSIRASFRSHASSFRSSSTVHAGDKKIDNDEQYDLLWAAVERLPTFERITSALFDDNDGASTKGAVNGTRVVNVTKIGAQERRIFMEKLIKRIEDDNLQLLQKIRGRIDKVGVKLPSVEVSYKDLCVEAGCKLVHGKPVPTVWNSVKSLISGIIELVGSKSQEAKINIIKDVSGIIKPGRMTLLLGPPGCGKTTLLMALSGKLSHSLEVSGEVCYNGHRLEEFVPEKTSAYVSQHDVHIAEITVRETLDFSAGFQGVGSRPEIMKEVSRREKQAGIVPHPDVDAYMKAISVKGLKSTLQTDYILKILGLDLCADTMVGDAIRRGISGGQKKRLTTGEMIVGPAKALFMDEISNGLDTSTTFQIVSCLQHFVHISDATALISLLQPAPETFDLFDDVVLMAEGKIVYHGPRNSILKFFEDCGFKCPERKGVADFLMELVISSKDQAQFWGGSEKPYSFVSVDQFIEKFKDSHIGRQLDEELSVPFDKSLSHKDALSHKTYSLPKWELFKACSRREFLLMRRNSFTYVFKSAMLLIIASVTMTVFLRTQMAIDMVHANYYMGALFYSLSILLVDGFPEVSMTVARIVVFYKQKELCFYPAWAYAIPASILKVPLSLLEAVVWTVLTYYVIGYTPEFGRFFRHFLLLFCVHLTSISMFRFIASIFQTIGASITASVSSILLVTLFGGFIIPITYMPAWLKWGFWICPLTYGEIGLSLNEFQAPRWEKVYANSTLGQQLLESRGLNFEGYFYWISIGALLGFTLLFNIGFTLALTFLKSPGKSLSLISYEKYHQLQGKKDDSSDLNKDRKSIGEPKTSVEPEKGKMVLPFEPLTITFQDVQYYVETPLEMRNSGFEQNRLQLLSDITGAFQPGVMTALMGVSGAGKTTLMDVLCGRKTGGTIEGDIRISGYPKIQDTFARISGYVEQNDIHSPHITVEESVVYSAWLRLPSHIDSKTKAEFLNEVLETIELDGIKDCLVGMAGVNGLSTEQRKRLTLAVEFVANPSIMFMDEPTSGLDARSAAIVMRTVKNIVATGRTVVCTIHQPSIDIFEAFDELVLMKVGGRIIYSGQLGRHSRRIIEYFESIPGVPSIKDNYNPATWMLEVTSKSAEGELGIDFAQHYQESTLYMRNKELVKKLSSPSSGSKDLKFPTRYPLNGWGQFKVCYWKQNLSYWRNPSHNLTRIAFIFIFSVLLGILFWNQGEKINNQQELFNVFGAMYAAILFLCIYNSTTVLPIVATERTVLNRERYAGMYSSWASSLAQVLVEVPYSFTQAVVYVAITYPLIGYHLSTYKIFWSFYVMFCTLLSFNYLGMLLVSLSPTIQVASILASSTYTMLNLFSGFVIPGPQIPKWWVWAYYLSPTSWALKGMFTSQYGDLQKEIVAFGEAKTIAAFVEDYFGYHHNLLGLDALVLLLFPIVHASLFAFFIGKLNFQRR